MNKESRALTDDGSRRDPAEIIAARERDPSDFLRRLASLLPDWHADAACRGEPVQVFFPKRGDSTALAYEFCGRCPVREQCLADAVADPMLDHGVRGGLSAQSRKARRRSEQARRKGPGV